MKGKEDSGVDYMKIFQAIGDELSYKDILQLDGAYSVAHINYGESPLFNNIDGRHIAKNSRKNSLSSMGHIDDVLGSLDAFNGTEQGYKKADRIELWKFYWLEYINAFDRLCGILPDSVVTIYVGRHAIELGFKYLLLKKAGKIETTHDLGELAELVFEEYDIKDNYMNMNYVDSFCKMFCEYVEGRNAEYFRFPEYKKQTYFAGNRLDMRWLSYNFALILLKLIYFNDLEKINTAKE